MSATLETLLIKKPKWFDLELLDDYSILEAVFDEHLNWINSFRRNNETDTHAEDSGTGANAEAMENYEDVPDAGKWQQGTIFDGGTTGLYDLVGYTGRS